MNATGAGPIGASAGNGSSWFVLKPLMIALVDLVGSRAKTITRTEMRIIREARDLGARSLFLLFGLPGTTCMNVSLWRLFPAQLRNCKNFDFIALYS